MSGLTGYLTSSGLDLSYVFLKGTTTTNSGYTLISGGDLSSVFKANTGTLGVAPNTGFKMLNNQDISTIYEPLIITITITNPNFTSPSASGSPYYHVKTGTQITGWVITVVSGQVLVGYGYNSLFNKIQLANYTQYCIIKINGSYITQNIQLEQRNYKLSFWIIGRNAGGAATQFLTSTSLKISVGSTDILSNYYMNNTSWVNVVVNFSSPAAGTYVLKFANVNTVAPSGDSCFLITGIIITNSNS